MQKRPGHFRHPLFLISCAVGLALVVVSYAAWDRRVAWFFFHQTDPRIEEIAGWISELGTVVRPEIAFAIWLMARKRWPRVAQAALFFLAAILASGAMNVILKAGFGRSRPEMLFEANVWGFHWLETEAKFWAFPSGHTASAMAAMSALALLFPRASPLFMAQAVLVGGSRVALMEHYVSDVIAGGIVGAAAAVLVYEAYFGEALRRVGWVRQAEPFTPSDGPESRDIQG